MGKIVFHDKFVPTTLIRDEKFSRHLTFNLIFKFMELKKLWQSDFYSTISDRSRVRLISSNAHLERHRNLSPPAPSRLTFDFFFSPVRGSRRTALSLHSIPSVPSTAAHFKGRYFFPRRSLFAPAAYSIARAEPTNERAPLNRATESARAERIGGTIRSPPIPTSRNSFSQRLPFACLRERKRKCAGR